MQVANRQIKKVERKLQTLPEGAWIELSYEVLHERIQRSIDLQSGVSGKTGVKGTRVSEVSRGWYNNHFSVMARDVKCSWGDVEHLWVRRTDGKVFYDWQTIQRIKNELAIDGFNRTGIQVFPPQEEVLDAFNWYHLWVLPPAFELPFSLTR